MAYPNPNDTDSRFFDLLFNTTRLYNQVRITVSPYDGCETMLHLMYSRFRGCMGYTLYLFGVFKNVDLLQYKFRIKNRRTEMKTTKPPQQYTNDLKPTQT